MAAFLLLNVPVQSGELADDHGRNPLNAITTENLKRLGDRWMGRPYIFEAAAHGFTEIGIERTPCFGPCPVYTFMVRSDGTFRYHGESNVTRRGESTGRISPERFHIIAWLLRESKFMEMETWWPSTAKDDSTTYISAVMDGKRRTIAHDSYSGPLVLRPIEELIDQLLEHAQWDERRFFAPSQPSAGSWNASRIARAQGEAAIRFELKTSQAALLSFQRVVEEHGFVGRRGVAAMAPDLAGNVRSAMPLSGDPPLDLRSARIREAFEMLTNGQGWTSAIDDLIAQCGIKPRVRAKSIADPGMDPIERFHLASWLIIRQRAYEEFLEKLIAP